MYAKIFAQIYDGTLCTVGPWEALVTFQQFLVLADQEGIVDMTAGAISRRTSIPLTIIEKGIAALLKPDPESRTPDEEGRRIVTLSSTRSWGWRIVNYQHYRKLQREADRREYFRDRHRAEKEAKTGSQENPGLNGKKVISEHTIAQSSPSSPIAYAEAYAEAVNLNGASAPFVLSGQPAAEPDGDKPEKGIPPCPHAKLIALYHDLCPTLDRVKTWNGARPGYARGRWRETFERLNLKTEDEGLAWFREFFEAVAESPWLTGKIPSRDADKEPFVADLEWLLRPKNFAKTIEGRYWRKK